MKQLELEFSTTKPNIRFVNRRIAVINDTYNYDVNQVKFNIICMIGNNVSRLRAINVNSFVKLQVEYVNIQMRRSNLSYSNRAFITNIYNKIVNGK